MKHKPKKIWQLVILLILVFTTPAIAQADPLDEWTIRAPGTTNSIYAITYGNGSFVAVGDSGTMLTSPDGATWTAREPGTTSWLGGITYGNGSFVAVGASGTILTSPDRAIWTQRESRVTNALQDVTYGNGSFVAVGASGTILTSPDGVTWTQRTRATVNPLYAITFGNGTFVAVGDSGTILTSPDGVTWTQKAEGTTTILGCVTFGNGTFVAGGLILGATGVILTSPDGVTWTERTLPVSEPIYGISYANGYFVGVVDPEQGYLPGLASVVLTSPDGVTWTQRTSGPTTRVFSVAYGNGSFVAVGWLGAIIQSAPASGINLSPGWNFISLPKQPSNTAIEAVLSDPSSTPVIVWGYDNQSKTWKKWKPQGTTNTLTTMETGKGYWVYMSGAGTIDMTGWTSPAATVPLYKGWNLVGYSGADNKYVPHALNTLSANWSVIWNWEYGRWQAKHRTITALPGVDALDTFRQMKAYWVRIDGGDVDWSQ